MFLRMLPDIYAFNSCFKGPLMLRHLKVRHTLKILQHLLQDFWSVSGHFGTKKYNMILTYQRLTVATHLETKMKSIQSFQLLKELKCYFLLVAVPSLVDQLDISQSFFKIRACILIISLLCIFAFISNNFTKK